MLVTTCLGFKIWDNGELAPITCRFSAIRYGVHLCARNLDEIIEVIKSHVESINRPIFDN